MLKDIRFKIITKSDFVKIMHKQNIKDKLFMFNILGRNILNNNIYYIEI